MEENKKRLIDLYNRAGKVLRKVSGGKFGNDEIGEFEMLDEEERAEKMKELSLLEAQSEVLREVFGKNEDVR